jgi:hypothetical protein
MVDPGFTEPGEYPDSGILDDPGLAESDFSAYETGEDYGTGSDESGNAWLQLCPLG